VGQLVSLAITPTIATGGAAPRVTVNWGDGTIEDVGFVSAARTVTHVYNSAGTFPVTATATTNGDATTTTTSVIVTERPAVAVNVSFTPATPAANGTVTLTANVTGAEAASVLRYEWVVSNADTGAVLQTQTTTGNQLSIIAAGNTSYIVRATAVTNDGRTGTGVTQFRVP
jgi:PKD repeat protein